MPVITRRIYTNEEYESICNTYQKIILRTKLQSFIASNPNIDHNLMYSKAKAIYDKYIIELSNKGEKIYIQPEDISSILNAAIKHETTRVYTGKGR